MDPQAVENTANSDIPSQHAVGCCNPFQVQNVLIPWQPGQSCAEILLSVQTNFDYWPTTRITVDGMVVRREYWHRVYPKLGTQVVITSMPQGGDTFRILAIITLAIVAPQIGGLIGGFATGANAAVSFSTASAIGTAAVFGVGMLAINALLPPSVPDFDNGSSSSQALSVGGSRNTFEPFGVKPIPLGTIKMFPYYAAAPVTELQGDDQYVTMLMVLGGHNVEVSNIKIGQTQIGLYDEVQLELDTGGSQDTGPITLYNDIVKETQVAKLLRNDGMGNITYASAATELDTDYIIYDIVFPQGLLKIERDGDKRKQTVTVVVEQSTDGINWSQINQHSFTAKSTSAIREGFRYNPGPSGQYVIRMWRTTQDHHVENPKGGQFLDDVYFSVLRSFRIGDPVNDPDAGLMAIRIKATDQLNGPVDTVNCLATSIIPDWTGSAWVDAPTNNPASVARWVLTGGANQRPLAITRLDAAAFEYFHDFCELEGFTYNKMIDYNVTVWDLFTEICHAGRGRPLIVDGLFTIRVDEIQTVPLQIFSPRNSWGFTGTKMFPEVPHALRVRYIDDQADYNNDEQIVYDDGYNSGTATIYEAAEFQGVTSWDAIWKHARYTLASIRLQPELFTFSVDFEQLAVLPSDRVEYQDDVILIGLGASRVKAIDTDSVTLDAAMPMEVGKSYAIQFRHADLSVQLEPVVNPGVAGEYETLDFPVTLGSPPAEVKDLAVFGVAGAITIPLLIKNIRPGPEMSAVLECLPYNDALYTADTGTIPDYDPVISQPPGAEYPAIVQIRSGESVMTLDASGNWQVRILGELGFIQNRDDVQSIIIQHRDYESGTNITTPWITELNLPGDSKEFSLFGYTEGDEVQIRARYVFGSGLSSIWTLWVEANGNTYHTVEGKTSLPPEPDILNVSVMSDGTRFYTYDYSDRSIIPPDFFGVRIRYIDTDLLTGDPIDYELVGGESFDLVDPVENFVLVQTNLTAQWDQMSDLRGGRTTETGYEANSPGEGDWIFAIKAIDDGGRESAEATYTLPIPLPIPRKGNNIAYRSEWENAWGTDEIPAGNLTGCFYNAGDGFLYADPVPTLWTSMPTWDTNPTWQSGYVSQIIFQQDNDFWDFGTPICTTWDLRTTVDTGSIVLELIIDGAAPVAWVDGQPYEGTTFAFKMTVNNPGQIAAREFIQEGFNSSACP